MAKKCAICGKGPSRGHLVSHSNIKTKRTWYPNLQKARVLVEGRPQRVFVCTGCLRSGKARRAV